MLLAFLPFSLELSAFVHLSAQVIEKMLAPSLSRWKNKGWSHWNGKKHATQ